MTNRSVACNKTKDENSIDTRDSISLSAKLKYDSLLASRLNADKYGMKKYIFTYFKKGPNRNQDSSESAKIHQGHMANINRLAD